MLAVHRFPQEAEVDWQGGDGGAMKVATLGMIVAMSILLACTDASVVGRTLPSTVLPALGSTRHVHFLSPWRNCVRTLSAIRAAW